MNITDTLALAVLGVCSQGPMSVARATDEIRCIGRGEWSPCTGTVWTAVERLAGAGLLHREVPNVRLRLTEPGRQHFRRLLEDDPPTATTPLGRVGLSLRICFLGSVPAESRDRVMRGILDAHGRELAGFDRAARRGQPGTSPVQRWLQACATRKRVELQLLIADAEAFAVAPREPADGGREEVPRRR